MQLYRSELHTISREADGALYVYTRTGVAWPDVQTVEAELEAVERAIAGDDTRGAALLIDVRRAPVGEPDVFVAASAPFRRRLLDRFRRAAVVVQTSEGAKQTTDLIIAGMEDCAVFRDLETARSFLGVG